MNYRKGILFERVYIMTSFLMAFFLIVSIPQTSFADISVDSYCQLSIQSMQQEVSNFQELIALANRYRSNPSALALQEKIKRIEFDKRKEALCSSFGTTPNEYVTYMGRNGQAVKAYIQANTEIKEQIDDLAGQVRSLLDQYESLKGY